MTATNVRIRNYGEYSSKNYGAHSLEVDIGNLTLYFSYDTVIAFSDGQGRKVSENAWGTTTGKHLNWIDGGDKKSRLPRKQFEAELNKVLKQHKLVV